MSDIVINIAKEYTSYPTGRYKEHGEGSGEQFRDEHLLPYLKDGKSIQVELSGTAGYASSFLEEAFGGLVRAGMSRSVLSQKLKITASEASYKTYELLAQKFIDDALARSH